MTGEEAHTNTLSKFRYWLDKQYPSGLQLSEIEAIVREDEAIDYTTDAILVHEVIANEDNSSLGDYGGNLYSVDIENEEN